MKVNFSMSPPPYGLKKFFYLFLPAVLAGFLFSAASARAASNIVGELVSPTPGTVISSATYTFQWDAHQDANEFWFCVGNTAANPCNLYSASTGTNKSVTRNDLPLNIHNIYVGLYTRFGSTWYTREYVFPTSWAGPGPGTPADITTPSPGGTITSSTFTFQWAFNNATDASICAGTTLASIGASPWGDLGCKYTQYATSATFNNIPLEGKNIYVDFWYKLGTQWYHRDYAYMTANLLAQNGAAITAPGSSETINSSSYTFQWSVGTGVTDQWFCVATNFVTVNGSGSACGDIYAQDVGTSTSVTVNNIPVSGDDIFVRLWAEIASKWYFIGYVFPTGGGKAVMVSPAPGSTLTNPDVTFQWTQGGQVSEVWLNIGTSPDTQDILNKGYFSGETSDTIQGVHLTNNPIYVELWSKIGQTWYESEYFYNTQDTTMPVAAITSPVQNTDVFETIDIAGTATDVNFKNYKIEIGAGASPSSWTLLYTGQSQKTNAVLYTWNSKNWPDNGTHMLRLSVEDYGGNVAVDEVLVNLDNLRITDVYTSPKFFNPALGETSTVHYTLNMPANVTIYLSRIWVTIDGVGNGVPHGESFGSLVQGEYKGAAGAYQFVWDGKVNGDLVMQSAYTWTVGAEWNGRETYYWQSTNPVTPVTISNKSISSPTYNPYANQGVDLSFTLSNAAWVILGGQPWDPDVYFKGFPINGVPYREGAHTYSWNGRDGDGNIPDLTGEHFNLAMKTVKLPELVSVVQDNNLAFSNVKIEPYRIYPGYKEVTKVYYTINRQADVTISIVNPWGSIVWQIFEPDQAPGSYQYEWSGKNMSGDMVTTHGNYRVDLVAEDENDSSWAWHPLSISVYR